MESRRKRTRYQVSVGFAVLAACCFCVVAVLQFGDGETVSGWVALLAAAANVATVVLTVRGAGQSDTQTEAQR